MEKRYKIKQKVHFKLPFSKYLRELSIVIIGVLITLLITNLISYKTKQREIRSAMILIKTELQDNLQNLEKARHKWGTEQRIYDLILTHINHIKEIPADTLQFYKKIIGDKHSLSVKTDSYEVFKSSMLMQYIKDKNFLRELSQTYSMIENLDEQLIYYTNLKGNGLNHLMNNIDKHALDKWMYGTIYDYYQIPLNDNVFRTFVYTGGTIVYQEGFMECKENIGAVIDRIDKCRY